MNRAWAGIHLYQQGSAFLHIKGKVWLDVGRIERPLLKRTLDAVKRGFGTASQGPTHKLLALVAKTTGYSEFGFPSSTYGNVAFYVPKAAEAEYVDFCDTLETLMHLEGSANRRAWREPKQLHISHNANLSGEKRKRLRMFLKEQSKRWAIYRQPMLDFLGDPQRGIVWEFDSDYKGESE